jgi:hypothetical protein
MDSYQPANGVTPEAFERITFSGVDPDTQPSLAYRLLGSLTKRGAQRNQVQHRARLPLAGLGKLIGAGLNKRFHEDDVKKGVPGDAQSAVENSRAFNYYHHRVMLPAITGVIQNIKREFADQFVLIRAWRRRWSTAWAPSPSSSGSTRLT